MGQADTQSLRTLFAAPPVGDPVFLYLAVVISILFLLSLLFAAYALLLRARNHAKGRRRTRLEAEWKPAILQALSGGWTGEILERVERQDHLFFLEFLMSYARRLKGHEQDVVREIARPVLPSLFPLLVADDPFRRAQWVQTLGALGLPEHHDRVVAALEDESSLVAMVAARSLARQGASENLGHIIQKLDRFENWSASYLTSLLVSFGSGVAPELRQLLVSSRHSSRVRAAAAGALLSLHDLAVVPVAIELLATETEVDLVAALLRLIRDMGRPEDLGSVRRLAGADSHAVRGEVFQALGALGGQQDLVLLTKGLDDPSPWVALHAARALRQLGHPEVLTELVGANHPRALLARQVLQEAA